jgi:hypothetical protein
MRLTPEREELIREEVAVQPASWATRFLRELFLEIDALREERDHLAQQVAQLREAGQAMAEHHWTAGPCTWCPENQALHAALTATQPKDES